MWAQFQSLRIAMRLQFRDVFQNTRLIDDEGWRFDII